MRMDEGNAHLYHERTEEKLISLGVKKIQYEETFPDIKESYDACS